MTTAMIPTGSRTSVLADLTRRRDNALDIMTAAEDASNERKWRKASARFWLRELQIDYLERTPEHATCPTCVWGHDRAWPVAGLFDVPVLWSCLEHWSEALEREADAMAREARWMGGDA